MELMFSQILMVLIYTELIYKINPLFTLGQLKRIFLSATLIEEVPIWILDEPTNGLDKQSLQTFLSIIKKHSEQNLVIFSSHDEFIINQLNPTLIKMG